jgi:N6-L-threonylcarbamoyladenine synthase
LKILSIETSCDETAVSILDASGTITRPVFKVLGNSLYSQVKLHAQYGGVFPTIAKRAHAKNLPPLLSRSLVEAKFYREGGAKISNKIKVKIEKILSREPDLMEKVFEIGENIKKPAIDVIGVTVGPGLEPALWVGICFAKSLGVLWNIPVIPINHMEGHIVSPLLQNKGMVSFPALALLISGGHTELVLSQKPMKYKVIGRTRDDALGEAYDKVARMLSLPYPGGPEISKLAEQKRKKKYIKVKWNLPSPMIHSKNYDFSFSGLKTAVLYAIKGMKLAQNHKEEIAKEFEDAVTKVIVSKTKNALEEFSPRSLIIGGGVIANKHIRKQFEKLIKEYPRAKLFIPTKNLATDNSIMIGMATFLRAKHSPTLLNTKESLRFKANGNLEL